MGRLRDLISGYRTARSFKGVDQQELLDLASMTREGSAASGQFNAAEHMERLAQAGLVSQPFLDPSDPRLQPIEGMSFDVYVKLVAGTIKDPTDAAGLEERGAAAGMAPATTGRAFELWGQRVVSDQELGVHYTAVLQAEVAAGG